MRGGGLFSCDTQYCADTNNIHEAAEAFMKFSRYAGNKQNYENDINKFKKYVQGQCYTNGKNVHTMKPCKGKAFQIDELVKELWTGTNNNKTSYIPDAPQSQTYINATQTPTAKLPTQSSVNTLASQFKNVIGINPNPGGTGLAQTKGVIYGKLPKTGGSTRDFSYPFSFSRRARLRRRTRLQGGVRRGAFSRRAHLR